MIFTSDVIGRFTELLKGLLDGGRVSEDRVRYALFVALRERTGIRDDEIMLEWPHPSIRGAKLDGFLCGCEGHGACAWELKYDRATPGGSNQPRSNKAGALINDFFRLAGLDETGGIERILIYLTDAEMARYFQNPRNGFEALFGLGAGARFRIDREFLAPRAASVRQKVTAPIIPCYAIGVAQASLPRDHQMRLYAVSTTDQGQLTTDGA
jgi:hypothetical protein